MIVSSLLTFLFYILSILFLRSYFDIQYLQWHFFMKVLAITLLSWLPLHMIKCMMMRCDPSEQLKILRQENTN